MSVIVYYCERCGRRIEVDEIEQGLVAHATNGYYCHECAQELGVPLLSESKTKKAASMTNPRRESKITTYKIRDDAVDEYELYGLDRKTTVSVAPRKKKRSSPVPVILAIVGVVVVIAVIAAAASSGGSPPSNPTKKRQPRVRHPITRKPPTPPKPSVPHTPRKPPTPQWQARLKEILKFWESNKENLDAYPEICRRLRNLLNTPRLPLEATDEIQDCYDNAWVKWQRLSNKYYKELRAKEAEETNLNKKLAVWESDIPQNLHREVKEAIKQRKEVIESALEWLGELETLRNRAEELLKKESGEATELGGIIVDLGMLAGEVEDWLDEAQNEEDETLKGRADLLAPFVKEAKALKQKLEQRLAQLRRKKEELEKRVERPSKPSDNKQNMPPWLNWEVFKQNYSRAWRQAVAPGNAPELTPGQSAQTIPFSSIGGLRREGNNHIYSVPANGVGWLFLAFKNGYEFRNYSVTLRIKIIDMGGGVGFMPRGLIFRHPNTNVLFGMGSVVDLRSFAKAGQEVTIKLTLTGETGSLSINGRQGNITLPDPNKPMTAKPRPNPPAGVPMLQLIRGAKIQVLGAAFKLNAIK